MIQKSILLSLLVNLVYSISNHPILIVVSYDAFGCNYLEKDIVPNIRKLRKSGTYTEYLTNVFPTKTFPNHHSIATGLYPEVHGVVGNTFYDPKLAKVVGIGPEMYDFNDRVVPIWRRNEDMGNGRYSGTMMWPGANFPYQNKTIAYMKGFDPSYDWYQRIDDVISWITHPSKPANLVMVYFEDPDTLGHAMGINSPKVLNLVAKLDNITQYLQMQLEKNKLVDKVNVVHVSDHGMISVTPPYFVNITQYMKNGTYLYAGASPTIQIIPKDGHEDEIYAKLKNASVNNHFSVYKKSEYPERWHYKNNERSPPILVLADFGYALDDLIIAAPRYAKRYNFKLTNKSEFGIHGYDYTVKEMHPIFMARGPLIKKQHEVSPFRTVDLYNLFCKILNIPATKNNGTVSAIEDILVQNNGKYTVGTIVTIAVGGLLISLVLISVAVVITYVMVKRQQKLTTAAALNKRFPQSTQYTVEAQHLLETEET